MKEMISEAPFFTPVYYKSTVRELFERRFKVIKIVSGSAEFSTQGKTLKVNSGEFAFVTPGSFSRIKMIPASRLPFRMICLNISDKFLTSYLRQNPSGINTSGNKVSNFEKIENDAYLEALYSSLLYYSTYNIIPDDNIINMKLNECMYILKTRYKLNLFSQFTDQTLHPTSLEEFINNNYMYNAPISKFAELSGRSLSTFRRECIKIWGMTPAKIIMEKRLEEAHNILIHTKKRPSEIYCELGFETLAHFSRCYKEKYGVPPSQSRTLLN